MDLAPKTTTLTLPDTGWLGSRHGIDSTRSVKLDMALFTAATHFPDGYLLSGIVLAQRASDGLYGPYAAGGAGGLASALGFLYARIKAGAATAKIGGSLMWHGVVVPSKLPAGAGFDTGARTALAPHFQFIG